MLLVSDKWEEYEILYAGRGEKTEKWGQYILKRPDPQIFWEMNESSNIKVFPDAIYHRSNKGGGSWEYIKNLPTSWNISYRDLIFNVKPTGFKHTGIFPEQAVNRKQC